MEGGGIQGCDEERSRGKEYRISHRDRTQERGKDATRKKKRRQYNKRTEGGGAKEMIGNEESKGSRQGRDIWKRREKERVRRGMENRKGREGKWDVQDVKQAG